MQIQEKAQINAYITYTHIKNIHVIEREREKNKYIQVK